MARDGSNPINWDSSYEYLPNVRPTTPPATGTPGYNPVTQRYAYAIYDEGSTLDVNVAGSPVTGISGSAVTYSPNQCYKSALAYADLTQLPGISNLTAAQQKLFVNAIVGWRNYSSAQATAGTFPGTSAAYVFKGATAPSVLTPFDLSTTQNNGGFLTVNGTAPRNGPYHPGSSNQTDNAFASRQQLLQFFLLNLGQNASFTGNIPLTTLGNVLPYLGTFSRDINQPSYGPDPQRPVVVAPASGGNSLTVGGATGGDAIVNPSYLSITATSAFTRNDGSTAISGEPLVKKRFALNRLAWLTYLGPITSTASPRSASSLTSPSSAGTDADIYQLEKNYGFLPSFLQQGTAVNIYNYFGFTWLPVTANGVTTNMWVYSHPGGYIAPTGTLPVTAAPAFGSGTSIKTLAAVQALGREPDFVELLKAAICVGSIGKASSYGATASDATFAAQYNRDTNLDFQVIQIAANVIAQSTTDNYPVHIYYVDATKTAGTYGSYSNVFHGIKNLPYINRIRNGILKAQLPKPWGTGYQYGLATNPYPNDPTATGSSLNGAPLTQTGLGLGLQFPELWNPHDWNTSNLTQTIGSVQPTQFRVIKESDPTYGGLYLCANSGIAGLGYSSINSSASDTGGSSAWFAAQFSDGTTINSPHSRSLIAANTALSFTLPATATGAALFREPMVLFRPNAAASASKPLLLAANTGPGSGGTATISPATTGLLSTYISGGGFTGIVDDPALIGDSHGQVYIGFYDGAFPLRYVAGTGLGASGAQVYTLRTDNDPGTPAFKVSLQYLDPTNSANWIT